MAKPIQAIIVGFVIVATVTGTAALYLRHVLRNPDRFIPRITAEFQKRTGKQIQIKHLEASVFPPLTVRAFGVEIKNPKPFPAGDLVNIPSLTALIDIGPLIGGRVVIRWLVLNNPTANVISDPDGLWNFQNPGESQQDNKSVVRLSMRSISRLQIRNGMLLGSALIDPADTPGPVVLELQGISTDIKEINFNQFQSASESAKVVGQLKADKARFGAVHTRDLHSRLEITSTQLTFKDLNATTYRGNAHGNFSLDFAGKTAKFATSLKVSGIGIAYLLKEFEAGAAGISGMMQANLDLNGEIEHTVNPLGKISGGGTFTVRNGEFPGIAANKNMSQMKQFRNDSAANLPVSAFSSFAGDMELKNHHIYSRHVAIDFYGIDVNGSGNLNEANGGIDYKGDAIIQKKQGFFTSMLARLFKKAEEKSGRLVFPIRVSGTVHHPIVSAID